VVIDDLVVVIMQDRRRWIESSNHPYSGRCPIDDCDFEFGPPLSEQQDETPNVSTPAISRSISSGSHFIQGKTIVDEDCRRRIGCTLEIDEVAKRELELVHAVDEGQIKRKSTEQCLEIVLSEEVVAGLREHPSVTNEVELDVWLRIDADTASSRERQCQ
jgi:hypothetical protein